MLSFVLQKVIDEKLFELLGERNEADNEKPVKKKKEKAEKVKVSHCDFIFHFCGFAS